MRPVHHPPCNCESCVGIHFFSPPFLLFLFSLLSFFLFCPPLAAGSPFSSVVSLLSNFSLVPFLHPPPPPPSHFSLLSLVSISPPGAGPQLCGVPVLLPTWAERLFPPGPPPGANDRAVPGQRQPLPHLQPQQQVGRTRTTPNNDSESWWTLSTSWFQKSGLQSWQLTPLMWLQPDCKSFPLDPRSHTAVGEQGLRPSERLLRRRVGD